MESPVFAKKKINLFPLMPARFVHMQPDIISAQLQIKVPETKQESFSVPLDVPHHAHPSQKRRHPTENIQSGTMLAGGRKAKPFSSFGPAHSQPGMEAKARLIFKHHRLAKPQIFEF